MILLIKNVDKFKGWDGFEGIYEWMSWFLDYLYWIWKVNYLDVYCFFYVDYMCGINFGVCFGFIFKCCYFLYDFGKRYIIKNSLISCKFFLLV